jgi:hypothetical protein
MHLIPINLHLMCANDGKEIVLFQKLLHWLQPKLDRALALLVFREGYLHSLVIIHRVRP